MSFSAHS